MDEDHLQAIAARDQLWASLRPLVPEIARLTEGHCDDAERERQLIQVLARIVLAELDYRANDPPNDSTREAP